jgi:limonene-1,2-epoxide hydrolase
MGNSDTIRNFLAAFNAKDIDGLMAFFTDDAINHNMPDPPVQGTDAIRGVIDGYTSPATAIDWQLLAIAESEDGTVLTERLDRFDFGGRWVELPVMGSFDVAGGKISTWRDYFDMAQFQAQMSGD